jgi:hypothetical protein
VPLRGLENLSIVRQNSEGDDGTIHRYPFDKLRFESHVHPQFVIYNGGAKLENTNEQELDKIVEEFPALSSIIRVYSAWMRSLYDKELNDPSFNVPGPKGDDDDDDDDADDDDDDDYEDPPPSRGSKKRKALAPAESRQSLPRKGKAPSRKALSAHNQLLGKSAWIDRIREWPSRNQSLGDVAWTDGRELSKPLQKKRRLDRLNVALPLIHSCSCQPLID